MLPKVQRWTLDIDHTKLSSVTKPSSFPTLGLGAAFKKMEKKSRFCDFMSRKLALDLSTKTQKRLSVYHSLTFNLIIPGRNQRSAWNFGLQQFYWILLDLDAKLKFFFRKFAEFFWEIRRESAASSNSPTDQENKILV